MRLMIIVCVAVVTWACFVADHIVDAERLDEFRECFPIQPGKEQARLVEKLSTKHNWGRELVFDSDGCRRGYTQLVGN